MMKNYVVKGNDNKKLLLSVLSINNMQDAIDNYHTLVYGICRDGSDLNLSRSHTRLQFVKIINNNAEWFSNKHGIDITNIISQLIEKGRDLKKISYDNDSIYIYIDNFVISFHIMDEFFWKNVDEKNEVIEEYNFDDIIQNFIYYSTDFISEEIKSKINTVYTDVLNYLRDEIMLKTPEINKRVTDQYDFYIGEIHIIMPKPVFNQYGFSNELLKIKQILNWSNMELKYTAGNFNSEVVFHLKEKVNFIKTFSQLLSHNINVVGFSMDFIPEIKILFTLKDYNVNVFGFINDTIISKYQKPNFLPIREDFSNSFVETPINKNYFRYPKQM